MKIAIVDYGSGNLRSVSKAIEKIAPISTQVLVTGDPEEVLKADRVVFPGQGAMPDCMKNLRTTGMEEDTPGLGIFPGDVVRFASDRVDQTGARLKVPQMGWNQVTQTREHPMWNGITNGAWFYFVHSYYAKPTEADLTVGTTFYGEEVTVAVARDNVFATQFHPEKSAAAGLALYQNFLTWNP